MKSNVSCQLMIQANATLFPGVVNTIFIQYFFNQTNKMGCISTTIIFVFNSLFMVSKKSFSLSFNSTIISLLHMNT